ncbi:hypothetical protein BDZ94DRAFT_60764 [Collybia nuda]|uniref:F-box domain-containing protein n=1 Tax=Collybia nuda TaxID=64659 RepID=A0A9P5YE53_9AGAR|nr:hypothetical protein BDZ94DRAFT_60764 [Collybia nuda]
MAVCEWPLPLFLPQVIGLPIHDMLSVSLNPHPGLVPFSDAPGDGETSSIRAYICVAEAEIRKLDLELALLLAKRARIKTYVHQCRLTIAPCRKLPVELITEIIRFCIPGDSPLLLKPSKWNPRLVLTQICTTWRAVAFDTPELCSRLKLRLDNPRTAADEPKYFMPKILDLITPYSRRFESLALEIQPDYLNSLFTLPFDHLEEAVFRLNYSSMDRKEKINLSFRGPLPSLQSVIIKNGA